MQPKDWISIIAIILSPIMAVIIALVVGEIMRRRNHQKEKEDNILERLIAFRFVMHSVEFLSAMNSIILIFSKRERIKELVKDLHRAFTNNENQKITEQRLVELIYEICKYKKYNVTEHEIFNLFTIATRPPLSVNPATSPANNSTMSGNQGAKVISESNTSGVQSITAGYL